MHDKTERTGPICLALALAWLCPAPAHAQEPVQQWSRFEETFQSETDYDNPVQLVALSIFTKFLRSFNFDSELVSE